ncbi:MAG: dihydroxyacetone kinase subunit L [Phycisphaerae bacterium]|nr:dihydroxyacetone kinase subunit L [Phycisphaerae bacterium]
MAETMGRGELVAMLRGAVERVRANHEMLGKLDSHGGDGDHGTTMLRAMGILEEKISAEADSTDVGSLLKAVGWGIMGVDGGATGPLFGMFFSGMAEAASGKDSLDAESLASALEAGLASIRKYTKAQVGDKTMIDALVPAVEAARSAADGGADVSELLQQAAQAAVRGAEGTKDLQARFGRAKNVGAKSVGNQDPGATSVSLIFKGFVEGVK